MKIQTPRGQIIMLHNGKAEIQWSAQAFNIKWQGRYTKAQKYIDSEVLRLSEPFIPLLTGTLIKTGILGTDIGSGLVQWIAPYARRQYYKNRGRGKTGKLRGAFWFERMKEIHLGKILNGVKKLAGGR